MNNIVKIFKAIGDDTRLNILLLLSTRNICAKGIAKHISISESAVSQHIKILKDAGLISGYKDGYYVMYNINKESFNKVLLFIKSIINDDISNESKLLNIRINEFSTNNCKTNCKAMKKCCTKLKEE